MAKECLTKDLEFLFPLLNRNINPKVLEELLNNIKFEPLVTGKILPYGRNIFEIRKNLQTHISKCNMCFESYEKFLLEEEAKTYQPVYELDREYLGLLY